MKRIILFFLDGIWKRILLAPIVIAIIIWIISILGSFTALDGFFYDIVLKTSISLTSMPKEVVLVEIDPSRTAITETELRRLLVNLHQFKPALVAFNFIPADLPETFPKEVETGQFGIVVLGTQIPPADRERRSNWAKNVYFGAVGLPPATAGISRRQHANYRVASQKLEALEVTAARIFLEQNTSTPWLPETDYPVHFCGGPGSLPSLDIQRVLDNDLVKSLIEGQCILVGQGRGKSTPGIYTPTTDYNNAMSFLEFQGHAINTLITGKRIITVPPVVKLLLFLIISFLGMLVYQRSFMQTATWITLGMLVFYGGGAYVVFLVFGVWLPIGEMILLHILFFILSIRKKNITADKGFQDLLLDLTAKLRERYYPTSIFQVKEHWAQVIAMVTQTFSLKRLIFLERVPKDHRVREVESFNCDLSDIDERRRDYHRFPYSEAIETNAPLLISPKRTFLKNVNPNEEQYLVPLSFAGDILGFWAFGVGKEDARAIPNFSTLISDYAFVIGELLYNRQEIRQREARSGSLARLTMEREQEAYQALKQTITFLKRRFDNITNLFNVLNALTIVYDLFGRVLEVNQRMLDLLKNEGLAPYDITLADLITRLTGHALDNSRQLLRKVVNDHKSVTFIVSLQHKWFLLSLRPLEFKTSADEFTDPAPFGIHGIICELTETTSMIEVHEIKEKLAGELSSSISTELENLSLLINRFDEATERESRKKLLRQCRERINHMIATVSKCHSFIANNSNILDFSHIVPVNPIRSIGAALDNLQDTIQKSRVRIESQIPDSMSYAYAMPDFLRHVFEHILSVLIPNTPPKGQITIRARDEDEWVTFEFDNEGFGMPNEYLEQLLFEEEETQKITAELRNLRESVQWIKAWGGIFSTKSEVGKGIHCLLRLARFN